MKKIFLIVLMMPFLLFGQESDGGYKKRVLETTEVDFLSAYYVQDGSHAAVTGGIGSEKLDDFVNNVVLSIPLNDDDVLIIDATVSAYSSASSSNLNPFSGASSGDDDDDDDDDDHDDRVASSITGTPWAASSGASKSDVWVNAQATYKQSSDDRNKVLSTTLSLANEYDYSSLGGGLSFSRLMNQKNTSLDFGANVFVDFWRPEYPTEIKTYVEEEGDLDADFFKGVPIWNEQAESVDKSAETAWNPLHNSLLKDKGRNTYSCSFGFSQILSRSTQFSVFADVVYQRGWLGNPMQRVYFADRENFYIGNPASIAVYANPENQDVFQLADDIERLPTARLKMPVGLRLNQYINHFLVLRTYVRYYQDDWGIVSNTYQLEMPLKLGGGLTLTPSYRYYEQTAANYFAPYESHLSSSEYYTSDYDLSAFHAHQYGLGLKYTDVFTANRLWKFALKNVSLNYAFYDRSTALQAHVVSFGVKLLLE
jgi:hypothetical protein